MIIGIDDSGNFEGDDFGMYASIYIRPKKADKIRQVFEKWEESIPDECKIDGEVKGWKLSEKQIIDFAKKVMIDNGFGKISHSVFAIPINDATKKSLDGQRLLNAKQCRDGVDMYRKQGKKYNFIAGQYTQMADWLESKGLKTLAKIELLGFSVYESFNNAIIVSALKGFDKELGKLTIKMDKGLVDKKSSESYWRDILRNMFWNFSVRGKGIIHLKEWRPNHPFLQRFVQDPKSIERRMSFTHEIRECMDFYDSKDCFEVRIADVIASTYFRNYIAKENLSEALEALKSSRIGKNTYKIINLLGEGSPVPNPYIDKSEN